MPEDIYWKSYAGRFRTYPKLIGEEMNPDTRMIVCIPVYAEPNLMDTLESLWKCDHPAELNVEVILLFNKNESLSPADISIHLQSWNECNAWIKEHSHDWIKMLPVYLDEFPDPKGGVGWARKIVMDEASRRMDHRGIIVCLDADCIVSVNYLEEINLQFEKHISYEAASVYFEHLLDGLEKEERNAIVEYELHLRYLVQAHRWCGHPFAYQTVGSCMAVRRNAYLSQGGMNVRMAGEDFYFIQKFIETGKLFEIKNTTVFPSPRISHRVPFGTGSAMQQITSDQKQWLTTNFEVFHSIRPLFQSLEILRKQILQYTENDYAILNKIPELSEEVISYLEKIDFLKEVHAIANQTTSFGAFQKRFFRYFNAFRMIRYTHFLRDHYFPDVPVVHAVRQLLVESGHQNHLPESAEAFLMYFRQLDQRL